MRSHERQECQRPERQSPSAASTCFPLPPGRLGQNASGEGSRRDRVDAHGVLSELHAAARCQGFTALVASPSDRPRTEKGLARPSPPIRASISLVAPRRRPSRPTTIPCHIPGPFPWAISLGHLPGPFPCGGFPAAVSLRAPSSSCPPELESDRHRPTPAVVSQPSTPKEPLDPGGGPQRSLPPARAQLARFPTVAVRCSIVQGGPAFPITLHVMGRATRHVLSWGS